VVYYKHFDEKADCISPILTIITPKGIEKVDLPLEHLENFFVRIVTHAAESEIFHFNDVLLQTCNPSENVLEDIVCQDLSKRDFMVNFSADVRTKNEFTDVVFWLVSICSGGVNNVGVECDGNIFVDLRERLSIEQENKDLASYRQIVSEGVYNCVILLVEKNMAVLRQDNRGMEFPDNTESAEFLKLLRSQMVSSSLPGMISSMVNIFFAIDSCHIFILSFLQQILRARDRLTNLAQSHMLEKKQKNCLSVSDWGISERRKVFKCSLSDVIECPLSQC